MKKNDCLKFLFPIILFILVSLVFESCSSSKSSGSSSEKNSENGWYNGREWLHGLQLSPHSSINQSEFSAQYQKNNKWWDEAFQFLKTSDLENLK
ncbi:MAG: hypothetical protein ABIR19_07040, partial [Ginsengibacter sp.]